MNECRRAATGARDLPGVCAGVLPASSRLLANDAVRLGPGDRALVAPGDAVVPGMPIAERTPDAEPVDAGPLTGPARGRSDGADGTIGLGSRRIVGVAPEGGRCRAGGIEAECPRTDGGQERVFTRTARSGSSARAGSGGMVGRRWRAPRKTGEAQADGPGRRDTALRVRGPLACCGRGSGTRSWSRPWPASCARPATQSR